MRSSWLVARSARLCRGSRSSSSAASSGLHAALDRHKISPDVVPSGADAHAVLRQLRLLETLGVPDVARAVARDPALLTHDTKALVGRHLEYLLSLGIPRVGPMIESSPQLLSCDLTDNLHRKVSILQALGVKRVGPWLYKNRGRIVGMDVDADMRPPVEYLQSIEGLQVHRVLEALPTHVFGRNTVEHMERRVTYLRDEAGVGAERVGTLVSRWPLVLTLSVEGSLKPKVEWLSTLGVDDVATLLVRHPALLSHSLANLQAKHSIVTKLWGKSAAEVARFPQALTYSAHFLRARAGFLKAKGRDSVGLHRALRTADKLFATRLAQASVEEYQAFAAAVKHGGGQEEYDAHDVEARAPGGGGEPYDWGDTTLDAMIEAVGAPRLRERGVIHPELTSVEKHIAFNNASLAKDRTLEDELVAMRKAIQAVVHDDNLPTGEAEVQPISEATAAASAGDAAASEPAPPS